MQTLVCGCIAGVHETAQRRKCFDLGEHHGLDMLCITKLVVESVADAGMAASTSAVAELSAATSDVSILFSRIQLLRLIMLILVAWLGA